MPKKEDNSEYSISNQKPQNVEGRYFVFFPVLSTLEPQLQPDLVLVHSVRIYMSFRLESKKKEIVHKVKKYE